MKLNIGCGESKKEGFVNIDFVSMEHPWIGDIKPDIVADAKAMPFHDNTFDEVFMTEVIEHSPRKYMVRVFDEIWRVLQPDGKFYFTFPDFIECMKGFIENRYGKRWENFYPTLYGRQAHKGDFHINPLEIQDTITKLFNSGFKDVTYNDKTPYGGTFYNIQVTCFKGQPLAKYI